MPYLVEKSALKATFEDAIRSNHVWMQRIVGKGGKDFIFLPSTGDFNVIFVERPSQNEPATEIAQPEKPQIRDFLGYGKKFHELRPTEDWMKELRDGEED